MSTKEGVSKPEASSTKHTTDLEGHGDSVSHQRNQLFQKTVLEPVAIKKTAATDISVSKFLEPEAPKNSAAADVHVALKNTTAADVSDVKILEHVALKNTTAADVSDVKFLEPVALKNTGAAEVHVALKNTVAADVSVHEIQLQQKVVSNMQNVTVRWSLDWISQLAQLGRC